MNDFVKIICRIISVLFAAILFYYITNLSIRMFGLENEWPSLIMTVFDYECTWPSIVAGFLGGILGLFMNESSWDKFEYYFPAVFAALFWGAMGFYAGYVMCDVYYLLPVALGIIGGAIGFYTGRGCWFGTRNHRSGPH